MQQGLGKTRSVVLETINNTALAGESMIISDPKRRTVRIYLQRSRTTGLQGTYIRF